jgi:type II secretory pathway component PulC
MRPLSYYDDEISRRDVFKKIINESALLKPIATAPAFKELVKDLHILGIISGSQKQVIIEDSKSAKTYFLGVGDYLEEIKIDEINADNVVLEFKDEKIVLFL